MSYRLAIMVAGLACVLSGCSGGTTETPSVATLRSAPAPSSSAAARPVFAFDATEDDKLSMAAPWADCMVSNGGPEYESSAETLIGKGGIIADDAKGRAALATCLSLQPEAFEDHQKRTDLVAFKDNQREWYRCAKAAGYKLNTPDPDTGQFGLAEIGPDGDFGSPKIQECRRKAFKD
ncbi:hypothetical protein [Winogradskya consettensis]|uniref:hypothetical protein n=1 Tax=Winogradskya consettensis TaxID=113560 RepID=UPI001BB3D8AE|nr:hypothetical protein [Actinoplanes consettensis]